MYQLVILDNIYTFFVSKADVVLETCYVHVGILSDGNSNQVRLFYDLKLAF